VKVLQKCGSRRRPPPQFRNIGRVYFDQQAM